MSGDSGSERCHQGYQGRLEDKPMTKEESIMPNILLELVSSSGGPISLTEMRLGS